MPLVEWYQTVKAHVTRVHLMGTRFPVDALGKFFDCPAQNDAVLSNI